MEFSNSARRLRRAGVQTGGVRATLFEALERRVLLSDTPLPDLEDMEDRNNTLVRFETDFGTIDMEMYDVAGPDGGEAAPLTVANFLDRIRQGDYDLSFFHRNATLKNGVQFVLQGGGFKWDDTLGLEEIPERETVDNEFSADRSNIVRSLSMARRSNDEDSANSQWFINLRDNSGMLDTGGESLPEGEAGYTVFGKILNLDSWRVVKDISGLTVEDFFDPADPRTAALDTVPTKTDIDEDGPDDIPGNEDDEEVVLTEANLVNIFDVEIIKAANTETFYSLQAAYPEGYRGPGTVETLELVNLNTDNPAYYQVIVRYERGLGRDRVVSSGVLEPNVHLNVPVNDFNDPTLDLVLGGAPYAYEVWATVPVAAALNRTDFGVRTSESLVNVRQASQAELQTWSFGGTATPFGSPADADVQRRPYLLWQNLSYEPANVVIVFTLQTPQGAPVQRVRWTRVTEPMRRDGLEIFSLANVPRDIASIRIFADRKIVAALSVYDTLINPAPDATGFTASGVLAGGLREGVIAGARFGAEGDTYVSFANDTIVEATITLTFVRSGEPSGTADVLVAPRGRAFFNLRNSGVAENEFFTIIYRSDVVVAGQYVSTINGDRVSTPFATRGSSQSVFGDGRLDPSNLDQGEIISLYNPYSQRDVKINIIFHFSDDKIQGITEFTLDRQSRLDVSVASLNAIVAKINSGAAFSTYSISINVVTDGTGGGSVGAAGVVAQLTRYDQEEASTTNAATYQLTLPLDAPAYDIV